VSLKALQDRLAAVLIDPRPLVTRGDGDGPTQRKLAAGVHADNDETISTVFFVN
jgi:hypothetical protein